MGIVFCGGGYLYEDYFLGIIIRGGYILYLRIEFKNICLFLLVMLFFDEYFFYIGV